MSEFNESSFMPQAVREALRKIQVDADKAEAERKRGLREQLAAFNDEIATKLKAHADGLVPFQERMDATYAAWLAASEAYEAERRRADGLVAGLRGQATALIQQISAPPAHFADMVRNWSRPDDYTGPEGPREFENKTVVTTNNWAYTGPGAPPPREFYNTPKTGPGRG